MVTRAAARIRRHCVFACTHQYLPTSNVRAGTHDAFSIPKVRVGRKSDALVRPAAAADTLRRAGYFLKTETIFAVPLQAETGAQTKRAEGRQAFVGLWSATNSVDRLTDTRAAGRSMRHVLEALLDERPDNVEACVQAIGSDAPHAGTGVEQLQLARSRFVTVSGSQPAGSHSARDCMRIVASMGKTVSGHGR